MEISQNFVAFLENMKFTTIFWLSSSAKDSIWISIGLDLFRDWQKNKVNQEKKSKAGEKKMKQNENEIR